VSDQQAQVTEENNNDDDTNASSTQALYAMLDAIGKDQKAAQNSLAAQPIYAALLANQDFLNGLAPANLVLGERAELQIKFNDSLAKNPDGTDNALKNQALYNLVFDAEANAFKVQSALGEFQFVDYQAPDFATKVLTYLTQNVAAVRQKKLAAIAQENQDKQKAADQIKQNLEAQKKQLADALHEPAFHDGLAGLGWKVADQPREENNKYVFDIVDAQNKIQFSVALEISSGMIKLIRNGQEIDVKNFLDTDGSKKKS